MKNTDLLELITKSFCDEINDSEKPADLIRELFVSYCSVIDEFWNKAYWKGHDEGYDEGYECGYDKGKEDGYGEGYEDGLNEKNY